MSGIVGNNYPGYFTCLPARRNCLKYEFAQDVVDGEEDGTVSIIVTSVCGITLPIKSTASKLSLMRAMMYAKSWSGRHAATIRWPAQERGKPDFLYTE